ncbi:MAG: EscN/YscN/HrcN family type III secretion system ATPase, partial [Pseudomonadota bacterium]
MTDQSPLRDMQRIAAARRDLIYRRIGGLGGALRETIADNDLYAMSGRVTKVIGTIIYAVVKDVQVGEIVELFTRETGARLLAEVVGFLNNEALLSPIGETQGVAPKTEVYPTGRVQRVPVGEGLRGRVLDGLGNFIDGKDTPFVAETTYPVYQDPPDPMTRRIIDTPLPTGIRAIDGLLTTGEGQRMGIFAAAGGGKSTLLSMLVKGAAVVVTVLALIGERGREVREFIEH